MSQTKTNGLHSLKVRQKTSAGKISTGANTEIFLDGEPLRGVTFLKFEFKPAKVTKVQLEMVANIEEIEGDYMIGSPYASNSEPVDKTQEIVDALLQGGLVYAPRESGKTAALARILQQDSTAVVFCDTAAQANAIIMAGNNPNLSFNDRVWVNSETNRSQAFVGRKAHIKVYIDDYTPGVVYPEWYAAVTSKIKVV